jgi:streptomycin 6-kinase
VPDELAVAMARQTDAVRVSAPGHVGSVVAAARVVPVLVAEHGLGEFIDALVIDGKPRLLLRFRAGAATDLGEEVVLKIYPDQPRGEGPLLDSWRRAGIAAPKLRSGELDGCSWLLMEYLELTAIQPRSYAEHLALTRELAATAAAMHAPAPQLTPMLRPLGIVMGPRWATAAEVLRTGGFALPGAWRARAEAAYRGGDPRPLHGDLGLPNIGRDRAGCLVVLDASALLGNVVFDAARWAARAAGPLVPPENLLVSWLEAEGLPYGQAERELLATECVLEAGARRVVATQRAERSPDREIRWLLGVAEQLFAEQPAVSTSSPPSRSVALAHDVRLSGERDCS